DGNALPPVDHDAGYNVLPVRTVLPIDGNDSVIGMNSGFTGRRVCIDASYDRFTFGKLGNLRAVHEKTGQQSDCKNDVHRRAGRSDQETLPLRFGKKLVGPPPPRITGILSGHLDVSTQRKCANPVVGFPIPKPDKTWAESNRESLDFDLE